VNCSSGISDDYSNIPVININEEANEYYNSKITIVFSNNTKLIKDFSGLVTLYNIDNTIIKQYSSGCSLLLKYNIEIKTRLEESTTVEIEDIDYYDLVYCKHIIPPIGDTLITGMFTVDEHCEDTIGERLFVDEFIVGIQAQNVKNLEDFLEYYMEYDNPEDLVFERDTNKAIIGNSDLVVNEFIIHENEVVIGDFNLALDGFIINGDILNGIIEGFEIEEIHI
jgi:hypothetical protein